MKMKIIIYVEKKNSSYLAKTCWPDDFFLNIFLIDDTKEGVIDKMKKEIDSFIDSDVRNYINSFAKENKKTTCQNGTIPLPADIWYCKEEKKVCPLQALVDVENKSSFYKHCLLESKKKDDIFNSIITKKYNGFHHIPGRNECPICDNKDKKINFNYHFPWELTSLQSYNPLSSILDNEKKFRELMASDFPRVSLFCEICSNCFEKILHDYFSDQCDSLSYEIYEFDYYR